MSPVSAPRHRLPTWPDAFDPFSGWPFAGGAHPMFDSQAMPLEDEMTGGRYEIRAEIPGIDPARDVDITLHDGRLTISGERAERAASRRRSEFSYGSFVRTIALPAGADDEDINATYDKGILTISVGMSRANRAERRIRVQMADEGD